MMVCIEIYLYIFELKVVVIDWCQLEQVCCVGVQYKIVFVYFNDMVFGVVQEVVEEEVKLLLSLELVKDWQYNFNYFYLISKVKKMGWLILVNVYDDGCFIYLKLLNLLEYKIGIFLVVFGCEMEYGEDFVVNIMVEGNMLIVYGMYLYLVICYGDFVVGL